MTPLMLMTLLSLVPFPILLIALLAGRWLQPNHQPVVHYVIAHAANQQDGLYR
ncbi:MAG: hypothetical protein K0S79_2426 [Nitrospira sp.]|jgi:hypothetical protein|nr:hypothetical protein [Nitrospira sp.]